MKLTKSKLKEIIREEIQSIQLNEANSTEIRSQKQLETVIKNNAKTIAKGKAPVGFHTNGGVVLGESTKEGYTFYIEEINHYIRHGE